MKNEAVKSSGLFRGVVGYLFCAAVFVGVGFGAARPVCASTLWESNTSPTEYRNLVGIWQSLSSTDTTDPIVLDGSKTIDQLNFTLYGTGKVTLKPSIFSAESPTGAGSWHYCTEKEVTLSGFTEVYFDCSESGAENEDGGEGKILIYPCGGGGCGVEQYGYYSTANTFGCGGSSNCSSASSGSVTDLWFKVYAEDSAACGNGVIESGEQCDDGNVDPNDGCSSSCQVELFADCDGGSPSTCVVLSDVDVVPSFPQFWEDVGVSVTGASSAVGLVGFSYDLDDEGFVDACQYAGPGYPPEETCEFSLGLLEVGHHEVTVSVYDSASNEAQGSVEFDVGDEVDPRAAPVLELDTPPQGDLYLPGSDVQFHVRTSVPYPLVGSAPVLYGLKVEVYDFDEEEWVRPYWVAGNVLQNGDLGYTDVYGTQNYTGEPPFGCFGGTCDDTLIFPRYSYGEPPAAAFLSDIAENAYRLSARVKFNGFDWSSYSSTVEFTVGSQAYDFLGNAGDVPSFGGEPATAAGAGGVNSSTPSFCPARWPVWDGLEHFGSFLGGVFSALIIPSACQFNDFIRVLGQFTLHFPVKPLSDVWALFAGVYASEAARADAPAACVFTGANPTADLLACFSPQRFYYAVQQTYGWGYTFADDYEITIGDLLVWAVYVGGLLWVLADFREMSVPD